MHLKQAWCDLDFAQNRTEKEAGTGESNDSLTETRTENEEETEFRTEKDTETEEGDNSRTEIHTGNLTESFSQTEWRILDAIAANPSITLKEISQKLDITVWKARKVIDGLRNKEIIRRDGAQKNGKWTLKQ